MALHPSVLLTLSPPGTATDVPAWGPPLTAALLGLGLGLLLGYGLMRSRETALRERLHWLRDAGRRAETLAEENRRLEVELSEVRAGRSAAEERLEWLQRAEEHMRASFESLARGVLREGGSELGERSREQMERLVTPLRQTLASLDSQVRELEVERQGAYKELRREIVLLRDAQRELHGSTRDLKQALSTSSGSRGRWGEVQLRRLVEMAGLRPHVDFLEQPVVEGGLRPDMVVHLPGSGQLPIDAKTPLVAYLAASEQSTEQARRRKLDEHLRSFKKRVDELGSKAYWQSLPQAPDFVVMFLPHDGMLADAFERDPELLEYCVARKVLPATPVTLLALLRTVAWSWQRQHVTEGAERIAAAGRELHQRLGIMLGHFGRVGRGLDAAVGAYNEAIGSLHHRLMPAARRLEQAAALEEGAEAPAP
ncbi:MAG: DNA recombination protein RmuC, partial [Acidobacteriota bacterium]